MYDDYRCLSCGKRWNFSVGTCGNCLTGTVIYDGAESKAAQERYEEQQKAEQAAAAAAKKQAEEQAAARRRAEKQSAPPNPLFTPTWNTPLAVVVFIAVGIILAGRDVDGGPLLIGAVVAGVLAGVFYRLVFAVAGIAQHERSERARTSYPIRVRSRGGRDDLDLPWLACGSTYEKGVP